MKISRLLFGGILEPIFFNISSSDNLNTLDKLKISHTTTGSHCVIHCEWGEKSIGSIEDLVMAVHAQMKMRLDSSTTLTETERHVLDRVFTSIKSSIEEKDNKNDPIWLKRINGIINQISDITSQFFDKKVPMETLLQEIYDNSRDPTPCGLIDIIERAGGSEIAVEILNYLPLNVMQALSHTSNLHRKHVEDFRNSLHGQLNLLIYHKAHQLLKDILEAPTLDALFKCKPQLKERFFTSVNERESDIPIQNSLDSKALCRLVVLFLEGASDEQLRLFCNKNIRSLSYSREVLDTIMASPQRNRLQADGMNGDPYMRAAILVRELQDLKTTKELISDAEKSLSRREELLSGLPSDLQEGERLALEAVRCKLTAIQASYNCVDTVLSKNIKLGVDIAFNVNAGPLLETYQEWLKEQARSR
jgi:hypothetical protein